MKKKNLAILLIIPFLVALFGIVTINTAFNIIDNDVIRIVWNYRDNELFEVNRNDIRLEATGVVADSRYPASAGNRLFWEVVNTDGVKDPHARTWTDGNDAWFLETLSEGAVRITCTTEKGNVTPLSMNGIIYSGSAFVVNTKVGGSGQTVDDTLYYGQYDLNTTTRQKQNATIEFDLTASSDEILNGVTVDTANTTNNLSVNLDDNVISINGTFNDVSRVTLKNDTHGVSTTFEFKVVTGGVNVYTYDDLLDCTNRSENGEIMVLRTNFESLDVVESLAASNVALFGTRVGNGFNFDKEVYRFDTTYNREYIDQWNEFATGNANFSPLANEQIIAGLRIQQSVYGNGYTINLHNLCYPSKYNEETNSSGETVRYAILGESDLFRGPKPFYLLGDPNSTAPLVTAYGQDNVGVYVDGSNITLNDVKIKNCDFGIVMQNLNYAGTVVEVHGSNVTIKNSVLSNGKNVLRSFSSMGLRVDNCILSNSRNFLLEVGSNEYIKNDEVASSRTQNFTKLDGTTYTGSLADYLSADSTDVLGDKILTQFTAGFADLNEIIGGEDVTPLQYTNAQMKTALHSLQNGLNNQDAVVSGGVKGTTVVNNTVFYRSGIASIGVESMFNGPFLYNNSPSIIATLLGMMGSMLDTAIPMFPNNISGSSYPVTVQLSGDTRFFDYKSLDEWDISGLIDQHISELAATVGADVNVTIDDIFPLKSILTNVASSNRYIYTSEETRYINIPIAYYGGGLNLSTVDTSSLTSEGLTDIKQVDLLDSYLQLNAKLDINSVVGDDGIRITPEVVSYLKQLLTKTVTTVTGFEAFNFQFYNSPQGMFGADGTPIAPDYSKYLTNIA